MFGFKKAALFLTIVGILFGFNACGVSESAPAKAEVSDAETLSKLIETMPVASDTISKAVVEGLQYMREEEKLARDVYITLNDIYDYRVFKNISKSEQIHMNAILYLLNRYGIEDPVKDDAVGVFTNPDLKELYETLIAQGKTSGTDALKVGAAIEEIDILDLLEKTKEAKEYSDVTRIYGFLERGSENHLRAFVGNLRVQGIAYEPQYLEQEFFDEIINSRNHPPVVADSTLTDDEKTALQYVIEEEKVAHDLYLTLYNENNLKVFKNIARAEQRHMNSVERLLNFYKVENPIKDNTVGVFANSDLQELYDTMVQKGSQSEIEALKAGAAMEEMDILDLLNKIETVNGHNRITAVFKRLEKGSEIHLRIFVRILKLRGITYEPQYLDQATFQKIINP